MVNEKGKPTRGVLRQKKSYQKSVHHRFFANSKLEPFVEHYWSVSWDLSNQDPYLAETLPYPSVHIVFQEGKTQVFGVTKNRFSVTLMGKGSVFGIKFRPGGFYPIFRNNLSLLTDKRIPISELFHEPLLEIEKEIFKTEEESKKVQIVEPWLESVLQKYDPMISFINTIIDQIKNDRKIQTVEQISKLFSINQRNLQRLFHKYVGVSPKWVVQRFRIQEVAERIEKDQTLPYAEIALELGYFDQSHFIKDFKNTIGLTPEEYLRSLI